MITGSIDNFRMTSDGVVLGGWACLKIDGKSTAVERFSIKGSDNLIFEKSNRGDFGPDNEFGFTVRVRDLNFVLGLVLGCVVCHAYSGDSCGTIGVWSGISARLLDACLPAVLADLKVDALQSIASVIRKDLVSRKTDITSLVSAGQLQHLLVEVGSVSLDGSVVVGRDGCLFLAGGANSVHALYGKPASDSLVNKWCKVLSGRAELCEDIGADFLQLIIPEKQSILSDLYPYFLSGQTPMLSALVSSLAPNPWFLDIVSVFSDLYIKRGLSPYQKVDTHLSFFGAQRIAEVISERFGADVGFMRNYKIREYVATGDLGNKFFLGNIKERYLAPDMAGWDFGAKSVKLVESIDPESGHNGTQRFWSNDEPLVDKSVVVFGNSVFERGSGPLTLSWWFARIFREVRFVWGANFDQELVRRAKPDFVVSQTVERFLTLAPTA